jgi:hypothetical protein
MRSGSEKRDWLLLFLGCVGVYGAALMARSLAPLALAIPLRAVELTAGFAAMLLAIAALGSVVHAPRAYAARVASRGRKSL